MKRLWWFSRFMIIVIALYCILGFANGYIPQNSKADEGGDCDITTDCRRNTVTNVCECMSAYCTHCLVPSSGVACGKCYKTPEGN
jgi:hypothetical protein